MQTAPQGSPSTSTLTLPGAVDNSTLPFFPPIRNQGSLNSCSQFATVYYTLTHMTAMSRGWDAKNGGDAYRFSPKWTYNMLNGGANAGTWHYDAFAIAQNHGLATWEAFPYDADYRGWCLDPATWLNALSMRADQFGQVSALNTTDGLNQLKQLLVNGYVLNVALYIGSSQWLPIANDPATTNDDAFVGQTCMKLVNGMSGAHCMTLVGYNDDIWVDLNGDGLVTADEKGALRVANSWGPSWNGDGFCWISYAALCARNPALPSEGAFWFDEAAWVTVRPAYTPQVVAQFTVNHACRNQMQLSLGLADAADATPAQLWMPNNVLSYAGGPWSFDGTAQPTNGTFCLDLTDLAATTSGVVRLFLGVADDAAGSPATLIDWRLLDVAHNRQIPADDLNQVVDAAQGYFGLAYDLNHGTRPPLALGIANPGGGSIPLTVSFDGSASYDPDGTIAGYTWDFGDGTFGSGATCSHTYTTVGQFTPRLSVVDDAGASAAAALGSIATDDPLPVACASVTPTNGVIPLAVSFNGSASSDPNGSIVAYAWSFGDGGTGAGATCNHTYTNAGTFTATLTVTSNTGQISATNLSITAISDFIVAPTNLTLSVASHIATLHWTDRSDNETCFYIERATVNRKGIGAFSRLGSVGANVTAYTNSVGTGTYAYRVQGFNNTRVSTYSNTVSM